MPILNNENQKKVPELPSKGNLDIEKVKESDYFFC
jgi:DNA-directed RNA polymerase